MPECEKFKQCSRFMDDKMANMPSIANMYKKYFCMEDNSDCARYMMVKAGLPIPPDLFPNMNKKAEEIIASRRR